MKNFTPQIKSVLTVLSILVFNFFGFSQTKIAEITFEAAGGYTTSIAEFTNGSNDYFIRTDGSNTTSATFTNMQGAYYFAAQDIDGGGAALPVTFLMNDVNVNGYTSLELRVHLAEDDDGTKQDWDDADYVHFDYDIDNSGVFSNLLWIEGSGGNNTAPFIDTNFDNAGDGTEITDVFTQFTAAITGTGTLLDIQIEFNLDAGDEDIAIDNIEIWGVSGSPIPTITVTPSSLTGFTYVEGSGPSAEQSFDVSGVNLTADISVTAPTNWEIAMVSGGPYQTTPITLTQSGGTVSATTIYTRMVSGLLNAGSPFSGNIACSSAGATTQNVAVDGTVTLPSGASCSDLFISEYVEGSSNNKYIEIFNPTAGAITLTGIYDIAIYGNGSATATGTIPLTGTIASYGVYVIENSAEALGVSADLSSGSLTFNGNDAVALLKSGSAIDVIGEIGFDPGSEWVGTTCTQGTAEGTLVRNFSVDIGDSNGADTFDPDTEWTCFVQDDISNLGSHSSTCGACTPTHTITGFSPTTAAVGATVTITGTGFTVGSTVEFFNGVSATVTFVNSTTLTATVPVGATTGVITVTEAGCTVDSASDFTVSACTPTHTITGFTPTSGPELTEVIITGTGFTAGTTVEFGGVSATIISQTATQLIVEVPVGAASGAITVTEAGCPLDSSSNYMVSVSANCSLSAGMPANFTDLLISGVYDDSVSSCHYIELLNPTTSDIDLSDFTLGFDNNFTLPSTPPVAGFSATVPLTGYTIPAQSTFMVQVTTIAGGCTACPTITPDYVHVGSAGLNDEDRVVLVLDYGSGSATAQDVWQNHSNGAGFNVGYVFARDLSANAPTATFDNADWVLNDTEDCFGFAISSTPPPTVDVQPSDITICSNNTFSITATPGNAGTLTYQWKYNDGTSAGWTDVTAAAFVPGTVTGETSDTLTITGFNLDGYQFYCAVTEDSACTVASNAAQYEVTTITWNGAWSPSAPSINDNAVINADYDTAINGSFSACQLFVNLTYTLTVSNSTYVEIENDVVVYGNVVVETQGAFVQNNDSSSFILDAAGNALVNKSTAVLSNWYDYTYWSSPIVDELVADGLDIAPASRRYYFNASNYEDVLMESNNDNVLVAGHDDIDDDGNDWQIASGASTMTPGVGYAATVSPVGFVSGSYQATFDGGFNNGVITTPIAYNGANGDNDWNFIGNPYPCAIDSNTFFTVNSGVIGGAAYLWSHSTPPSDTTNGNEVLNFAQADYAVITQSGVNVAGGDGIIPSDYIPSGQGFFVQGLASGNVTFNNSMRMADTSSNNQFFRTPGIQNKNILWVNLRSDNGAFNQVAIGYHDTATDGDDGFGFDATRNLSTGQGAIIFTSIDGSNKKYAVQGKSARSFVDSEVVPLGLLNLINEPTNFTLSIAQVKGIIIERMPVYLRDKLLGIEHNLTESDYNFTSETGEFNDRFEIVFKISDRLIDDILQDDELIVVDNGNSLDFSTSLKSEIASISIYDLLGRRLLEANTNNKQSVSLEAQFMSSSVYIVKVLTSDGRVFTKKISKQ